MEENIKVSDEELAQLFADPQRPRWKLSAGAAVVLGLVACAVVVLMLALQPRSAVGVPAEAGFVTPTPTAGEPSMEVPQSGALVHVLGAVAAPGVYELGPNARVVDAIAAAGGLTEDADTAQINLARPAVDGEQIYVPKVGETPPIAPDVAAEPGANGSSNGGSSGSGGLVNLNTASAIELETLPRIGPAMAQRIIDYRDANGGFSSIDQLKDISGIGEATFEQLKPLVTV